MRILARLILFALLGLALLLSSHAKPVVAQTETETRDEPLETFVPSEKLPADSAISFPVDI